MAMKIKKGLGTILLAIWLIATGVFILFRVMFSGQTTVMAVLAVAAGLVLLFEK